MGEKKNISIKETTIEQLVPDDKNFNKGTEFGSSMIEKSLRTLGAGRSIVLDKNNRIISGNKTVEGAAAIGLDNVIVVETTGDQIVAVKRTDIDLDSKKGRELALADNATSAANLDWDTDILSSVAPEFEIDTKAWGLSNFDMHYEPNLNPEKQAGQVDDADIQKAEDALGKRHGGGSEEAVECMCPKCGHEFEIKI